MLRWLNVDTSSSVVLLLDDNLSFLSKYFIRKSNFCGFLLSPVSRITVRSAKRRNLNRLQYAELERYCKTIHKNPTGVSYQLLVVYLLQN